MKNLLVAFLTIICLTACQQQKIAYVDQGELINEFNEKKAVEEKYKLKTEQFNKKRDSMVTAFQLEIKEAEIKARRMSQAKVQALSREFQQKEQLLGQKIQIEQEQLTKAFQTELDSTIKTVKDFVKNYGKTNGYTYILGTSDVTSNVMHGTEDNNLTQTILKELNKENKE